MYTENSAGGHAQLHLLLQILILNYNGAPMSPDLSHNQGKGSIIENLLK